VATASVVIPENFEEAADLLAAATGEGRAVRISGAGTKPWAPAPATALQAVAVTTTGLDRILAHDPGDMTATLQAGVPLHRAQEQFAQAGQMLALDPPTGADGGEGPATIGGILATGDSGPLSHRYGGPRDLVVGATVALADGTIARSGGTVIKNVAGYDVAKLLCGSFGTLGLIVSVNVRLHPRPETVSAIGAAGDAATLAGAAHALAARPAELEALDVAWEDGRGVLLARCAGPQAEPRARRVAEQMGAAGLQDVRSVGDDEPLWERQRLGQRSSDQAVLRIAAPPACLADVLVAATAAGATLVARAALGHSYATLDPERIAVLRDRLPAAAVSTLHDCPPQAREAVAEPWGRTPAPALAVMRAVKARFDPTGTCNPGSFVGGI
jgi:glycolate oxidase FAD binding subunit